MRQSLASQRDCRTPSLASLRKVAYYEIMYAITREEFNDK
jgi:hypothetical protein